MANAVAGDRLSSLFFRRGDEIFRVWIDNVATNARNRTTRPELERELKPMFDSITVAVQRDGFNSEAESFGEVRAMLAEYARTCARQGLSPSETAITIFALRDAVLALARGAKDITLDEFDAFCRMIDDLGLVTFETHSAARESVIASQTEQLLELSTPVVKLWEGVLAVPLVGTLDSARTQIVMEALLQMLVSTGSSHAIIDITGVPAVDTQVAQHLLKTVSAARLMGATCVISGIRPQIAQTVVALGIDFGEIATKASLADALRHVLARQGFELKRVAKVNA